MPFMALPRSIELGFVSDIPMHSPMLDIGCCDGLVSKVLFNNQNIDNLWGGDLSKKALIIAKKEKTYSGLFAFDARFLPFHSNSFNSVFSISVLEHIPIIQKVLKESLRVLKPGGILQFTTTSDQFKKLLLFSSLLKNSKKEAYLKQLDKRLGHYRYFSNDQWNNTLREIGFINIKCSYLFNPVAVKVWNIIEHFLIKKFNNKEIYKILWNTWGLGWMIRTQLYNNISTKMLQPFLDKNIDHASGGYLHVAAYKA